MPFNEVGWWGWGAWRERREFVGRVSYGVRWHLWTPKSHTSFPRWFQRICMAVLVGCGRHESLLAALHTDIVYFILNQVEWWDMEVEDEAEAVGPSRRQRAMSMVWSGLSRVASVRGWLRRGNSS